MPGYRGHGTLPHVVVQQHQLTDSHVTGHVTQVVLSRTETAARLLAMIFDPDEPIPEEEVDHQLPDVVQQ